MAVGLLVILTHASWLFMPLGKWPELPTPTFPALTAFSKPGSQVWSPILFSLPSPTGFSGVTRADPVAILPPLQSPLDLNTRHPLNLDEWFPASPLPPAAAHPVMPLTPAAFPQPSGPRVTGYVWTLRILENDNPNFLAIRLPRVPAEARALSLEGILDFDRYGQVSHLLIDPPGSPAGQRTEITQSLMLMRLRPEDAPARLRFRLSLEPRN
jgi:hypothetical protein